MKLKKISLLALVAVVAVSACRDDDEKVNRTRQGGGAIVESNPDVTSVSFAECGAQITDIQLNPSGAIVFPANMVNAEGMVIESQEAIPMLQATVGFVLRNDGGNVRVTGNINGDIALSADPVSVSVDGDGGNAVLNIPLNRVDRSMPAVFAFNNITVAATHTRLDNEVFGPCQGSRGIDLQIEIPEPIMAEEM